MKHCHECDSEVGDLDIFCPYCGITLKAAIIDESSNDDAFSSTIVIPPPPSAEESGNVNAELTIFEPDKSSKIEQSSAADPTKIDDELDESAVDDLVSDAPAELSDTESSVDVEVLPKELDSTVSAPIEEMETPLIAQRLTGSIGSISGRFSPPNPDEISEILSKPTQDPEFDPDELPDEAESEIEGPPEGDIKSLDEGPISDSESGENMSDSGSDDPLNDPQSPTIEEIAVPTDDVPTPMLLVNNEIEGSTAATDESTLDEIADAESADTNEDQADYKDGPGTGTEIESDPSELIETDTSAVQIEKDLTIDSPVQQAALPIDEAGSQDDSADPSLDAEPVLAASAETGIPEEAEIAAEQTIESSEDQELPVAVTDEPLQHAVSVTGDGLSDADPNGGTTPNIGSGDTDGRRSGLKPLAEGTVLNDRYLIKRKIGGGGMGAVYLAFDNNLGGVERAVKEMVQAHIEEEQQEKAIDDFKRESMILSTLDHPSIPTIYDYFFDSQEGRFYLVMKYISGGDLAGKLRSTPEGRIDERTVTDWALQIIDVLDYLHNLPTKIVYRDLKPSNVMIDGKSGRIMLIDFGIARSINQNQEKGVTAVGTMGYAPPELFSGNVEPRSDIYSLGSTMFHLLTGADPQNNPLLIFDFQKNPRPRQINPQLSDQIERILMRAVEYNADARFASAAEMKFALASHLENLAAGQVTFGVTEVPQSVSLQHQIVFCGFCGQRIVATDMFCAFCGSKQPLAQHGVHREVYSHSIGTARLVIEGTSDLSAPAYGLEKNENLVGRRDPMSNIFPEVDLSKYDPQTKISRRHAKIWRDGNNYLVEDLGSSNGTILLTKVSDTLRLLPHQPHPLASGDRIRIGDTTLQFIVG
ncbi:MAG: protein kinase [Pyrinomonadaceae bacterium]|nr:protein kinase [Pyrinomonadaceae bacterium]